MTERLMQTSIVSLHAAHVPVLHLPDFFLSEFHFQIPWCSVCLYGWKMLGISLKMIPLVSMMFHTGLSWERRDRVASPLSDEKIRRMDPSGAIIPENMTSFHQKVPG